MTFNLSEKILSEAKLDTEDVKEFIRLIKEKLVYERNKDVIDKYAGDKLT